MAETKLPTKFGTFRLSVFQTKNDKKEHVVLTKGSFRKNESVLVRIHSECLTGDVFHSKRCDCGEQLKKSLEIIGKAKAGIILYLRQEGRGIGLVNKIKAYELQDQGFDTIEANKKLGFKPDMRTYDMAREILCYFGVKKIKLLTNNPEKMMELEPDIKIVKRIPLETKPNKVNLQYLRTKKERFGHLLKNV